MIYTGLDNFYLTDEQLAELPSVKEGGLEAATEFNLRVYGASLIQEGGLLLKSPQVVMATGQVLLQRFYCKKSFTKYPVKRVACACLWLATKLEESPRKLRDVLNVFLRMECRREGLPLEVMDYLSRRYDHLKSDIIRNERLLLREFGFVVHVEHPHKFVLNYLQMMGKQDMMQEAWSLVNDSLRSPLCVRFNAEVVACGVIFYAARRMRVSLPEAPPWWTLFNVELKDIEEVARMLEALYTLPRAEYIHVVTADKSLSVCGFADPEKGKSKLTGGPAGRGSTASLASVQTGGSVAASDSPASQVKGPGEAGMGTPGVDGGGGGGDSSVQKGGVEGAGAATAAERAAKEAKEKEGGKTANGAAEKEKDKGRERERERERDDKERRRRDDRDDREGREDRDRRRSRSRSRERRSERSEREYRDRDRSRQRDRRSRSRSRDRRDRRR